MMRLLLKILPESYDGETVAPTQEVTRFNSEEGQAQFLLDLIEFAKRPFLIDFHENLFTWRKGQRAPVFCLRLTDVY